MILFIDYFQCGTLLIAVFGAGIGLFNFIHELRKSKVRLKVSPITIDIINLLYSSNIPYFAIEIINLSDFEVTIVEVGILYYKSENKCIFINYKITDQSRLPRRLGSRDSITVYIDSEIRLSNKPKCVYAKTACGKVITGQGDAIKYFFNNWH